MILTLVGAVRLPRYKAKHNPLQEIPDMIHSSGYRDGALAVLSLFSGKELK